MKMNKHIETIVSFKDGAKDIVKQQAYDFADAWMDLLEALKRIIMVVIYLLWLLLPLAMITFCLPLATWIRLKAEKEYEEAAEKAKREYMERMTCLHKERGESDE